VRSSDHDIPVARFLLSPDTVQVVPAAVVNSASFSSGMVAPLEIVSIFWRGTGVRDTASIRVTFDGVPARVLFASRSQINAVVPIDVARRNIAPVRIESDAGSSNVIELPVTDSAPAIFTGAILNEDYSVNTRANPATRESVLMMWGTGMGGFSTESVSVRIGARPAEVLYAGQAPGFVEGAVQINARIPADAPTGEQPVMITVGDRTSAFGRTVAVR
jgi:uncharacterized protein (TIGR03437 family)